MELLMMLTTPEAMADWLQATWQRFIYPFAVKHRSEPGSTLSLALKLASHGDPEAVQLINAVFPRLARHLTDALH